MDIKNQSDIDAELKKITNTLSDDEGEPKYTKKKKVFVISLVVLGLCIIAGIVPLTLYLIKLGKLKIDSYHETQYDLLIKPTISVLKGQRTSTTHDSFHISLFALDMEGDKYRFLVTNASIEIGFVNKTKVSIKSDYFIYLELESNSGKILLLKYKEEMLEESTVKFLTGVTQVFVVDQDSEREYPSECKKKYKDGYECSQNSRRKEGTYFVYEKYESSDNDFSENQADYQSRATTWVNQNGKVEKCEIKGWFSKTVDKENLNEKANFNVSASVEVASSYKLDKSQINKLNDIVKDLPEVKLKRDFNMTTYDEFIDDDEADQDEEAGQDEEDEKDDEFNQDMFIVSDDNDDNDNRALIGRGERRLFSESFTSDYFSFYSIPFKLNSYVYSAYDENLRAWFCGIHRFAFGDIELKIIKKDFCLSSHGSSQTKRKKIKKWIKKRSMKKYIATTSFSIFTFSLYAKVKVKGTPYLEVYYNTYGNTVTNVEVESKITVSITGEASVLVAKGGITFKNTMKSVIENYMVGYYSPFSAYVSLDKSLEATFEIWVKYLELDYECFDIFGIEICLPTVEYSKKKIIYDEDYGYSYYEPELIFSENFL
ncbi:hypothetical protein SteCoe_15520 [Stentor coeruleus]|uniref:Uncharacterized protein n=1 Tax=Stentor coeruleus TaxID=5963 RepID=A0A1R2C3J1_9CILI|nr:hypothetical protein SteCoe_15520 [Stentor coeruleus]